MKTEQENIDKDRPEDLQDGKAIENAFEQMEMIYRSRCVQAPHRRNVTVREIEKPEDQ